MYFLGLRNKLSVVQTVQPVSWVSLEQSWALLQSNAFLGSSRVSCPYASSNFPRLSQAIFLPFMVTIWLLVCMSQVRVVPCRYWKVVFPACLRISILLAEDAVVLWGVCEAVAS